MAAYVLPLFLLTLATLVMGVRAKSGLGLAGLGLTGACFGPYALQAWSGIEPPALMLAFVFFDLLAAAAILRALVAQHPKRLRCREWLAWASAAMAASIAMHGLYAVGMARPLTYTVVLLSLHMAACVIIIGVASGGRYVRNSDGAYVRRRSAVALSEHTKGA